MGPARDHDHEQTWTAAAVRLSLSFQDGQETKEAKAAIQEKLVFVIANKRRGGHDLKAAAKVPGEREERIRGDVKRDEKGKREGERREEGSREQRVRPVAGRRVVIRQCSECWCRVQTMQRSVSVGLLFFFGLVCCC